MGGSGAWSGAGAGSGAWFRPGLDLWRLGLSLELGLGLWLSLGLGLRMGLVFSLGLSLSSGLGPGQGLGLGLFLVRVRLWVQNRILLLGLESRLGLERGRIWGQGRVSPGAEAGAGTVKGVVPSGGRCIRSSDLHTPARCHGLGATRLPLGSGVVPSAGCPPRRGDTPTTINSHYRH